MVAAVESMAYVGEVPWHGLGVSVNEDMGIDEMQEAAGLNWSVSKRQVWFPETENLAVANRPFKNRFVLTRDSDQKPYCVVSNRYHPVQPSDVVGFFRSLVEAQGYKIHTLGSLKDGATIWCLASVGKRHNVAGVDPVDSFLLITTSYDLSMSTIAMFTSVRVVCMNTLGMALHGEQQKIVVSHVTEFNEERIKDQLGIRAEGWGEFSQALDAIAKIKMDVETARKVIDVVFKLPEDPELRAKESNLKHANNVINMFEHKQFIGADIAGETGWGLLNSVTEYVDFHKRANTRDARLNNAWFGEGNQIKQRALDEIALLAA